MRRIGLYLVLLAGCSAPSDSDLFDNYSQDLRLCKAGATIPCTCPGGGEGHAICAKDWDAVGACEGCPVGEVGAGGTGVGGGGGAGGGPTDTTGSSGGGGADAGGCHTCPEMLEPNACTIDRLSLCPKSKSAFWELADCACSKCADACSYGGACVLEKTGATAACKACIATAWTGCPGQLDVCMKTTN